MSKKISKSNLIRELNKTEALEILIEKIERNWSASKKNSLFSQFQRDAKVHIEAERDVILISVKVK